MEDYTIHHAPEDETIKAKKSLFGRVFKSTTSRHYPGQPSSEITQRIVYLHIAAIIPFVFAIFALAVAGIAGVYYMENYENQISRTVSLQYLNLIGFLSMVMLVGLLLAIFWIWRRNKLVITNEHIVDIRQIGIFNRTVSTLRLEDIQDVTAKVHGPTQTIFQYGTLNIQTAGSRANFILNYIAEPYEVEHYILEIRKKFYDPEKSAMHHETKSYL